MSQSPFAPWWVKNAGHSDIVVLYPDEYIAKLFEFFAFCEREQAKETPAEHPEDKAGEQVASEEPNKQEELPHSLEIENLSAEKKEAC